MKFYFLVYKVNSILIFLKLKKNYNLFMFSFSKNTVPRCLVAFFLDSTLSLTTLDFGHIRVFFAISLGF
jgi:hypothetical protein